MTHDPIRALQAAVTASRAYQRTLRPPAAADPPDAAPQAVSLTPDPDALARLTAPAVSRLIARQVRERRLPP